jgi:hypothetical protein
MQSEGTILSTNGQRLQIKSYQGRYTAFGNRYLWIQPDAKHLRYIHTGDLISLKDRLCSGSVCVPTFALYPNAYTVDEKSARIVNLFEVVDIMRGDELKTKAAAIKSAAAIGDISEKVRLKKELPYITHTGIFLPRENKGLRLPGFTFQLDIDYPDNPERIIEQIINDRQLDVLIASKSVSGKGVKALLFLRPLLYLRDDWTHDQYRTAYHQATDILYAYFLKKYQTKIDTQMKAISQPFFLFSAPNLYINKNFRQWG